MRKPAPAKHRIETRSKDGAPNEILIWFGEQVIFHLKRMAPDFIWFASYIDNKGEDVEIKIADAILTMNGTAPKPTAAARKSGKEKPPTPDGNAEETKPETAAATASESAT